MAFNLSCLQQIRKRMVVGGGSHWGSCLKTKTSSVIWPAATCWEKKWHFILKGQFTPKLHNWTSNVLQWLYIKCKFLSTILKLLYCCTGGWAELPALCEVHPQPLHQDQPGTQLEHGERLPRCHLLHGGQARGGAGGLLCVRRRRHPWVRAGGACWWCKSFLYSSPDVTWKLDFWLLKEMFVQKWMFCHYLLILIWFHNWNAVIFKVEHKMRIIFYTQLLSIQQQFIVNMSVKIQKVLEKWCVGNVLYTERNKNGNQKIQHFCTDTQTCHF